MRLRPVSMFRVGIEISRSNFLHKSVGETWRGNELRDQRFLGTTMVRIVTAKFCGQR